MTKEEKEAQQAQLDAEKKVIRELRQVYERARKDCEEKIRELGARTDVQNLQSIIYQKQYQQALKKQLDGICDILNSSQFTTIGDYLVESYYNGYIGTMYDIAAQGIPLTVPIKQEDVTRAIQVNSKIKGSLYESLGEDVKRLKNSIRAELSRGISNGSSYEEIAAKIARGMNSPFNKVYNNTLRIAKTEGHRVQQEGTYNAQMTAKKKGADVVKQWDSTLDGKTRPTHRELDGQIAEVEDLFVIPSTGNEALYPGGFGIAAEDINCRCCSLQRAKWALDQDELVTLAERATYFGIDKSKDFEDFKEKYLKVPKATDIIKMIYTDCSDLSEAETFAKEHLGLDTMNYSDMNLAIANIMNRETLRVYQEFGNLNDLGVLDGLHVLTGPGSRKADYVAGYQPAMKEVILPQKNVGFSSSVDKLRKMTKREYDKGIWSTKAVEHTFRHELGHAVSEVYMTPEKEKEIEKLFLGVRKKCNITVWDWDPRTNPNAEREFVEAKKHLSYYGLKTTSEFVAESIAEYMNGNPRETAAKVVEILKR